MLAGQPLGATIGFGTQAHIITAFSMDLNGNGITVSNDVWNEMKAHSTRKRQTRSPDQSGCPEASDRKVQSPGKPFNMGMVFPVSRTTMNYAIGLLPETSTPVTTPRRKGIRGQLQERPCCPSRLPKCPPHSRPVPFTATASGSLGINKQFSKALVSQ